MKFKDFMDWADNAQFCIWLDDIEDIVANSARWIVAIPLAIITGIAYCVHRIVRPQDFV